MKFPSLLFCFLFASATLAQREITPNYRKFDDRLLHFGFMLGANSANFIATPKLDAYQQYGLRALEVKSQPGGQVGIVTTMKVFTPVVRLRFIPTLSFQERAVEYYYENPGGANANEKTKEQRVNSTNLDFPLMIQFRTLRVNNFAAYLLAGGQYSYDLQSQQDASQNFKDPFLKIKADDWQGQVGVGVEFFAQYFKFGMEVKYSQSFSNSLIQDNTEVSKPIDTFINRVWWFSLIFEG